MDAPGDDASFALHRIVGRTRTFYYYIIDAATT